MFQRRSRRGNISEQGASRLLTDSGRQTIQQGTNSKESVHDANLPHTPEPDNGIFMNSRSDQTIHMHFHEPTPQPHQTRSQDAESLSCVGKGFQTRRQPSVKSIICQMIRQVKNPPIFPIRFSESPRTVLSGRHDWAQLTDRSPHRVPSWIQRKWIQRKQPSARALG